MYSIYNVYIYISLNIIDNMYIYIFDHMCRVYICQYFHTSRSRVFPPNRPSNSFQDRIFCSRTGTSIPTTNFQYQAAQKSQSNPFLAYGLHGTATSRMQRSQQFSNNLLFQLQQKAGELEVHPVTMIFPSPLY